MLSKYVYLYFSCPLREVVYTTKHIKLDSLLQEVCISNSALSEHFFRVKEDSLTEMIKIFSLLVDKYFFDLLMAFTKIIKTKS